MMVHMRIVQQKLGNQHGPIQILHRLHCRVFMIEIMCWVVLILLLGAQKFLIMITTLNLKPFDTITISHEILGRIRAQTVQLQVCSLKMELHYC